MSSFFTNLISSAAGHALLLPLAIVICTILFEDASAVIVGVLAADGDIPVTLALFSLYVGTVTGDCLLYSIGYAARTHPRLARFVDHEFATPLRTWLTSRYRTFVFLGHWVPGLRSTTYLSSGFFKLPFSTYILTSITSGLLLNTTLFSIAYFFGSVSSSWAKELRWGMAAVFILVLFLVARHNLALYRKLRAESDASAKLLNTNAP